MGKLQGCPIPGCGGEAFPAEMVEDRSEGLIKCQSCGFSAKQTHWESLFRVTSVTAGEAIGEAAVVAIENTARSDEADWWVKQYKAMKQQRDDLRQLIATMPQLVEEMDELAEAFDALECSSRAKSARALKARLQAITTSEWHMEDGSPPPLPVKCTECGDPLEAEVKDGVLWVDLCTGCDDEQDDDEVKWLRMELAELKAQTHVKKRLGDLLEKATALVESIEAKSAVVVEAEDGYVRCEPSEDCPDCAGSGVVEGNRCGCTYEEVENKLELLLEAVGWECMECETQPRVSPTGLVYCDTPCEDEKTYEPKAWIEKQQAAIKAIRGK